MLAIVAFASGSAYLTRYCISAANTTIQHDLGFSDPQMGQLMGAFGLGYFLCQVPGGWLGNRVGTRFAFAFLSVAWSLSNVCTAISSLFNVLWASRLSLGMFQAGLVPLSAKVLKDWIPIRSRGLSSALITASMSIGGASTMWLTGWLLKCDFAWRAIFAAYSLVGIVWASGFSWYFRTLPEEHQSVNAGELALIRESDQSKHAKRNSTVIEQVGAEDARLQATSRGAIALHMLRSPEMWGLCIQSFFRAAGYMFFVTWFFAYLEYVYGIDKAEAGMLNSLPLLAVVVGSILGGVIVDWLLRATGSKSVSRSGTAFISLIVCGLFTMASAWTSSATELSVVIAVGALFSGIAGPAAWAATIDIGGRQTAVVMGTMNMAGGLAAVILPIVLGNWFEQIRETNGRWDQVIYLHAAFYFAGAVSWIVVNPNREVSLTPSASSLPATE